MSPLTLFAVAIQLTMTTKIVLATLAAVAYAGIKYWASLPTKATRRDDWVAPKPEPEPTSEPAVVEPASVEADTPPAAHTDEAPCSLVTLEAWMGHWRCLMEVAIGDRDERQVELLNLMIMAKTEEAVFAAEDHDEAADGEYDSDNDITFPDTAE